MAGMIHFHNVVIFYTIISLTLTVPKITLTKFANCVDPDETAQSDLIWLYSVNLPVLKFST